MSAIGTVDCRYDGEIAHVTLNRPQALNALTMEMYGALGAICERLADGEEQRVVVFRGAGGRAFSAGTDIGVLAEFTSAADGLAYERSMDHYLDLVASIPVPTVAIIEGLAVGGGLNIAAACDIRVATDDSRFGAPIARTLGSCLSMRNFAGLLSAFGGSRAKRMLMLGELLDAEEALASGFLARIASRPDFEAAVDELIGTLLANAPITQR